MLFYRLRERVVTWAIRDSVPVLNLVRRPRAWPTLDELEAYPDGTLGREVARFMHARGLPFLPHYENHDALHLLLGYDTTARGELELQAFAWGNGTSSFAGRVLFVWGALMLPEHVAAMRVAHRRGQRAQRVDESRLPNELHTPLATLEVATGS